MKALVFEQYAKDDDFESILNIKDIPEPIPKSHEVVIKVLSLIHISEPTRPY